MANPVDVADILELWVWSNQRSITASDLTSWLETAIPEQSIDIDDVYDDADDLFNQLTQETFDEILRRKQILGDAYPYVTDGNRIRYMGGAVANSSYLFCLLLSHLPAVDIENEQRTFQFEGLALEVAESFFGGSAIRIGFPWEADTYREILDRIRALLPSLGEISLEEEVTSGDRGWDLLVVKGFNDGNYPKFVALGNCATGRNDWMRKGSDTEPEYLWEYFQSQRPGTYITFSVVPFTMDDDARRRRAGRSHFTFDRFRICELAPEIDEDVADWIVEQRDTAGQLSLDQ